MLRVFGHPVTTCWVLQTELFPWARLWHEPNENNTTQHPQMLHEYLTIFNPRPNDRNIWTQQIATLAQHVSRVWPPCCEVLRPVGHWKSNYCAELLHRLSQTATSSPGQMIATFHRNISQHCWGQYVARVWPTMCCDMWRGVGFCWLKLENGQIFHLTPKRVKLR